MDPKLVGFLDEAATSVAREVSFSSIRKGREARP